MAYFRCSSGSGGGGATGQINVTTATQTFQLDFTPDKIVICRNIGSQNGYIDNGIKMTRWSTAVAHENTRITIVPNGFTFSVPAASYVGDATYIAIKS